MSLDAALETFYVEAQEHLELMDNNLLQMDDGNINNDILNDIFRSAHTIKGSAGIFGLTHIVDFTHVVENVLDRARDEKIVIEKPLIDLLFKCRDHMVTIVALSIDEYKQQVEVQKKGQLLIEQLLPWADEQASLEPINENKVEGKSSTETDGFWHISLRLSEDCLKNGMDPMSFIRFLSTLGVIHRIVCLTDKVPKLVKLDPEQLYFAYEIALESASNKEEIENTFMFVQDDSHIVILPPNASGKDFADLIEQLPEDNKYLIQVLKECGTYKSLDEKHTEVEDNATLTEISTKPINLAEKPTSNNPIKQTAPSKQIRIDSDRLDHLINLIGELVINQQRVDLLAGKTRNTTLIEAVDDFESFTEQIRDAALNLRMIPIGGTFQRFKRIVRDTAQELGKNIGLTIIGSETELDRLMVEKIADPLTHIVRNAMDHGIESVEERIASGKSPKGELILKAYHESGHIVIAISDDGKGINKEGVRLKAIEKGIIFQHTELSDHELFHLIFHPGFSTAAQVTNLSGRGVGMDVVKRNVEALQGSIEILSEAGKGSEFRISLPLTLAIIDGFHVECSGTHFIIPQATIIECLDLASHVEIDERNCINLRGDMIPYLTMSDVFNLQPQNRGSDNALISQASMAKQPKEELVIVQFGGNLAGIAVERLHGEVQTVIKPLGPIFKPLKGIGGSSLLGNGDIAFILDIPQLIELAIDQDKRMKHINKTQE
ncbi:chemotaxis protein CheA [Pseudoalteromonas phenolica]|uniref:chemotaxis protein CheA n=1 Tax=Pseudoalteromonas phenolica TaxID=161398 RepID=UPI00110AB300|nr:chemotaxis protein CheA [Pseudoalteromonas phenolica]TMN92948.1 chemotaxis protein CheA [Pseudoalteromonas phenolica]